MKKFLILSTLVFMASHAWAACTTGECCVFGGDFEGNCWAVDPDRATCEENGGMFVTSCEPPAFLDYCLWNPVSGQCAIITGIGTSTIANCESNNWHFTGLNLGDFCDGGTFVAGKDENPPTTPEEQLGCCRWNAEDCGVVTTTQAKEDCKSGAESFFSETCAADGICPLEGSSSSSGGGGVSSSSRVSSSSAGGGVSSASGAGGSKIIADFTLGTATAFTNYSYGYGYGVCEDDYSPSSSNGYFTFTYTCTDAMGNQDGVAYEIAVQSTDTDLMKTTPTFPITDCVGGFSYDYKGAAHIFVTEITEPVADNVFKTATKPYSAGWTNTIVTPGNLAQATGWGTTQTWQLSSLTILKWVISNKVTPTPELTGDLSIDNVLCLTVESPSSSAASSSSAGASSSSAGVSSSSSAISSSSGGVSSSSRSSSSSYDSFSPIIHLPNFVRSNALNAMSNGINLAVTKDATVKVFDMKGTVVSTFKFAQGSYNVSLSNLPRGLYIVKASNASWSKTITLPVK